MDFAGHGSGSGSSAPLFGFAAIALVDGLVLTALYLWDRSAKRFGAAFWFFVAVALWWLVSAQLGFAAAGLDARGIPWGAINAAFLAALAFAVVLLLIASLRKGFLE